MFKREVSFDEQGLIETFIFFLPVMVIVFCCFVCVTSTEGERAHGTRVWTSRHYCSARVTLWLVR